jgi:Fur family ferric uptake transcriptional regulator
MAAESRIERICLDKGMKMTEQRRVIARVLSESSDHPHVEEVHRRAHVIDPRISIATVYRTVRLFEEANIIERHEFRDGRARYEEVDANHHHHHLINLKTGDVIEFENEQLERLKRKICRDLGFTMVGERLELYGVPLEEAKPEKVRK